MDGGCYTVHLQRTLAGAEPWHDEGVEPLRPQPGHRLVVRSDSRRGLEHKPGDSGPPMPASCGHSPAPSCGAKTCARDQTMRPPTCRYQGVLRGWATAVRT